MATNEASTAGVEEFDGFGDAGSDVFDIDSYFGDAGVQQQTSGDVTASGGADIGFATGRGSGGPPAPRSAGYEGFGEEGAGSTSARPTAASLAATVLHGNPLFAWELDAENFKDFWWVTMQAPASPSLLGARVMQMPASALCVPTLTCGCLLPFLHPTAWFAG